MGKLFLCLILVTFTLVANAQHSILKGRITDTLEKKNLQKMRHGNGAAKACSIKAMKNKKRPAIFKKLRGVSLLFFNFR